MDFRPYFEECRISWHKNSSNDITASTIVKSNAKKIKINTLSTLFSLYSKRKFYMLFLFFTFVKVFNLFNSIEILTGWFHCDDRLWDRCMRSSLHGATKSLETNNNSAYEIIGIEICYHQYRIILLILHVLGIRARNILRFFLL